MTPARRQVTVWLIAAMLGPGRSAWAAPWTLDQLMGALAGTTHGAALFTENKYLSILEEPVSSSGELRFVPPARLEKRTLRPKPETLVLDGGVLTVEREAQRRVLRLQDYPEVAGMVESIRATLAGDRAALERVYRLGLEGSRTRWTLVLTPLDPRVAGLIERIRIDGARGEVRRVEILQADGDRSVMDVQGAAE
jgi:hypothetical protein